MFSSLPRRGRIALILMVVLSLFVFIMSLGMVVPHTRPFGSLDLNGPVVADSDGHNTVIADTEARRVLVLDERMRLISIISFDVADAPIDAVTDLCVSQGTVYVAGIRYLEGSTDIDKERVISYDVLGAHDTEVFTREGDGAKVPSIKSIGDANGDAIITVLDEGLWSNGSPVCTVYLINNDEVTEYGEGELDDLLVHDAGFDPVNGYFVTISPRGMIDDDMSGVGDLKIKGNYAFTSVDVNAHGDVFVTEDGTGDVCIIPEDADAPEMFVKGDGLTYTNVHVNEEILCACSREGNEVVVMSVATGKTSRLHEVELSFALSLFLALVWVCRLFLVGAVLVVCIARLRRVLKTGESDGLGGMFAAFCVVLAVGLAIGYTSFEAYRASLKTRGAEVKMLAELLQYKAGELSEAMDACSNRHALRAQGEEFADVLSNMYEVSNQVWDFSLAAQNNGIGVYYRIFSRDDEGVFLLCDGAEEFIIGSSLNPSPELEAVEKAFEDEGVVLGLHEGRTLRDTTQYCLVTVWSNDPDKGIIGVIELGSMVRSFESQLFASMTGNIVAMFVMMFVVYIVYSELRSCSQCLLEYLKLASDDNKKDAVALLTRPFTFLITMLISTDAVMSTLIGRSLLEDANLGAQGLLLMMPAVMQGLGLVCGQIAYGSLGWRVGVRRLICGFAILLMAGAVLAGFVVAQESFWGYLIAKFVLGIPFGLLYTLGYSLPRQATTDEVRALASGGVRRTDTSAAAMGTVLGGLIASRLGNAWVYVLVALGGALVIAFATRLVLRHQKPLESEGGLEVSGARALMSFFRQPDTLALIILIMMPAILAGGYNSLLFPIYSADLGVSSGTISYMFVLGQLVVYVFINTLDICDERFGKWRVTVGAVALLAAVFLFFSLNTRLTWAIVAIALVAVFCKASDGWKALWARQADLCEVPLGRATGAMFATRSVLLVVQPLILGALLNVSRSIAAILLGIICLVCVCGFVVLTRHSKLRV